MLQAICECCQYKYI